MRKSFILSFFAVIISSLVIFNNCSNSVTESVPPVKESVITIISGTVLDESNAPIVGA